MNYIFDIFSLYGLYLLATRLKPKRALAPADVEVWPKVSVIIPARNEGLVIANLIRSLDDLDYPDLEIIVVDDCSEDNTADVVTQFDAKLVRGKQKPSDWMGKQWACHQGAQHAAGDILLFTDADTVHARDSLKRSVSEMIASRADVLTALPYHTCLTFWERINGAFHILLLSITAPFARRPKPGQIFAIGQYLMFRRQFYERIGGHKSVKNTLVEDLPLAQRTLESNGSYLVYPGFSLYSVRMYETLGLFIRGWRRNFRAGFKYGGVMQTFEVFAMLLSITALTTISPLGVVISGASLIMIGLRQRRIGQFSVVGVIFPMLALGLFIWISVLATLDQVTRKKFIWKGRLSLE